MKNDINTPIITIVTVVYNSVGTIKNTIESVLKQKTEEIEYWIIDGNSTDGSVDIIESFTNEISGYVSEPDNGIYDAMNKGIKLSTGKWVYFLGSDDVLIPGVLRQILKQLDDEADLVFGDVSFNTGGKMISFLGVRTYIQNTVHHQSAFYKRSLFYDFNYDVKYRAIADYELNLRVWLEKRPFKKVNMVIAKCYASGVSSDFVISLNETNLVRNKLIKNKIAQFVLDSLLKLYYFQKKVRGMSLAPR